MKPLRYMLASTLSMRVLFQLLCFCTILLGGSAAPFAGADDTQTIQIEPLVPLSASGGDDLRLIRSYFSGASWEGPIPDPTWQLLRQLGISKFRLINVESSDSIRRNSGAGANQFQFDFESLKLGLQDCRKYDAIPHIIVGQRLQHALATHNERGVYGISNWQAYDEYAYAFLKFVMIDQGFAQAAFEVANEPDLNGASWLLPDKLPKADPRMYAAYFRLYKSWAQAAATLAREHPELQLSIGGPDITSFTLRPGQFDWAKQFVSDVAANKLRLDFFSFHFYGNNGSLSGQVPFGPYPSFETQINHLRTVIKDSGLSPLPLYVTEWGASHITNESPVGIINGNNVGAAWAARFLMTMAEQRVEQGLALIFRDHVDYKSFENNWGWPGFLLSDGITPKALYNAAMMFTRLPGTRVKAEGAAGSLGVIASSDKKKIGIIVFNQGWDFTKLKERAETQRINLRINGLPFSASRVHVRRYLIDNARGNAEYFYRKKMSIDPAISALNRVEESTIDVKNNLVDLQPVDLAPSSLSLWEITTSQ